MGVRERGVDKKIINIHFFRACSLAWGNVSSIGGMISIQLIISEAIRKVKCFL